GRTRLACRPAPALGRAGPGVGLARAGRVGAPCHRAGAIRAGGRSARAALRRPGARRALDARRLDPRHGPLHALEEGRVELAQALGELGRRRGPLPLALPALAEPVALHAGERLAELAQVLLA